MRITSRAAATGSSFLSMLFLGVGVAIVGATARAVGLTAPQIGYLVAVQNVGFGIAVVVGGALSDRHPKPAILTVGLLMLGLSFALLYRSEIFAVNLGVMLVMGLGMGTAEAVTDALLLEMYTKHESRLVTINHFFVSIGSVSITLYLMALNLEWSSSLLQTAAVLGALAIVAALLSPPRHAAGAESGGAALKDLSSDFGIVLLFLSGVGAIGIGVGSAGVITTYVSQLRGIGAETAQVLLAIFLSGLAVGRIAVGLLGRHNHPGRIAAVSAAIAVAVSLAYYTLPVGVVGLAILGGAMGLTVAPLLPLTIALAGLRFRSVAGTAMGIVKLSIPIGGIVIPGLAGLVSDVLSFRTALYLFPLSALIVLVSTIISERRYRTT